MHTAECGRKVHDMMKEDPLEQDRLQKAQVRKDQYHPMMMIIVQSGVG